MNVYISKEPDGTLLLRARLEDGNGTVGDSVTAVEPGHMVGNATYAELLALGEGPHDFAEVLALTRSGSGTG
ncbi:MAG: hypothetical protein IPJ62_03360 [Betaproteobacteria bacterium]|nr:hypothetical protein [Betaproteobacteria bacterium]